MSRNNNKPSKPSKNLKAPLLETASGAPSRHANVVDFFKSVWQHHDLSVKDEAAPQPSERAKQSTREEALEWHASLRGSPLLHSRRFFLVGYGIELLEDERTKREMHVSLLGYSSFVLIFLLYVFTNVPVANTFLTKRAIHDSVVDSTYVIPNSSSTTSFDIQKNTLRNVQTDTDVWNWLLYGLTNTNLAANSGPFSETKRIAEWNVVIGAVRLRQIRLKDSNCLVGKTKITSSLDVFKGTDCHGVTKLNNIATTKFGPGTIKSYTNAPMVERSDDGL
jgi:hypothetical protein